MANREIVIIDAPRFNNGDIVKVDGVLRSGVGVVFGAFYPTEQPVGELSWEYIYGQPFPQLGVRFVNDGKRIWYNADDLNAGKLTVMESGNVEPYVVYDILHLLDSIYAPGTEAYMVVECALTRMENPALEYLYRMISLTIMDALMDARR